MGLRDRIAKSYSVRPGYWFAPKRFGWGLVPVTWQGLVATAVFVAAIVACATLSPGTLTGLLAMAVVTMVFILLARRKTDGEVKWHWSLKK